MSRKPYYADYINHCLRFYCRNTKPFFFETEAERTNWQSCDFVLKRCSARDRNILIAVYKENDTLADNVYRISKQYRVDQDDIWSLINEVSRKIAKHRGLL